MAIIDENGAVVNTNNNGYKSKSPASKLLMDQKAIQVLDDSIAMVNLFINHAYLATLNTCDVVPISDQALFWRGKRKETLSVFEVSRLVISEKEDMFEKLITHYSSFNGKSESSPVLSIIIKSDGSTTKFYICCDCNDYDRITREKTSRKLMESSFRGNFPGSELTLLSDSDTEELMDSIENPSGDGYVQSISTIPSRRQVEQQNHQLKFSAQGIEKFIDGMQGKEYTLMMIAQPMSDSMIQNDKNGLEMLYTAISPYSKESVSYGRNESDAANYGISQNMSKSVGDSISKSYGTSHTEGTSGGRSGGGGSSYSSNGFGSSSNYGWNSGWNSSDGVNITDSTTKSINYTEGNGLNIGVTTTVGTTATVTMTRDNKAVLDCMDRLKKEIERIESNRAFGMWSVGCYVYSHSQETAAIAASSLQALLAGDAGYGGDSYSSFFPVIGAKNKEILSYLALLRHPKFRFLPPDLHKPDPKLNVVSNASGVGEQEVTPALTVAGKDLPVIMGLPKRSVAGVQVLSMAEFGRNFPKNFDPKNKIEFGEIMHMGIGDQTKILFDRDAFASHSFICGASGTGKSNTTFNLLNEFRKEKIPFLVIEPVKGEYKLEFGSAATVYTTLPNDGYRNFVLNPFEFHEKVNITQHMDYLNSAISSCWPLYGTMPSLLKQAIEEAYINCGWDTHISQRIYDTGKKFPTFEDVLPALERIINNSDYSEETKGEYKGALCMRIRQLMTGFEGRVFGSVTGVPDSKLFGENSIVDLSSLGNIESRSVIMAILVIRLREYRFATQKENNAGLQHVTVLEEAHNILKRCSHEQSQDSGNAQGKSVEALVNCIAEMRSAGEGFMIIDQSPSAVDEAAIKNTAIKISMRLPSESDCKAIGHALNLQEDQIRELSRLDTGVAAIYHENWSEAVLGKMGTIWKLTADAALCRRKAQIVLRGDVVKYLGVVAQWVCYKYLIDPANAADYYEVPEALDFIRKTKKNSGTLTDDMWDDIELQLRQFIAEIKAGAVSYDLVVGKFLRELLQIDDLFRFPRCKLILEDDDETYADFETRDDYMVSDQNAYNIDQWWKEISRFFKSYVQMPVKYGMKTPIWSTAELMECETMKTSVKLILKSYSDSYDKEHLCNDYLIAARFLSSFDGPLYTVDA